MFLTQGQVERGHFTNNRYGTAGTTTQTTLASSGGLLVNIDSATGDIARTTSGFIEDAKYGWYVTRVATAVSAEFDTAVTRTGTKTLKLSTTDATGRLVASQRDDRILENIPVKSSTKYKFSCWVKTTNAATASGLIKLETYNSSGTFLTTYTSNTLTGTNDWTLCTVTFTSDATAVKCIPFCSLNVAGNISDAWFDINSMTLEEVVEPVANSLTSSSPSLVSFTAVGSTDNIDQSQTSTTNQTIVGASAGTNYWNSQSFTATKSKHTGVTLYKKANIGTPTGNFKVDVRTDNAGDPSTTVLATYTMPLATYNALTTNADFTINLPCNLTAGTKYHYVISDTATETGSNSFAIAMLSAGGYTGGDARLSTNSGTSWSINGTADLYFKSLYYKPTTNFKASQNNQSVSISADEDGFLNTSKYDLTTGTYNFTHTNDTTLLIGSNYSSVPNLYSYSTTTTGVTSDSLYRSGNTVSLKGAASGTVVGTYKIYMGNLSSIRWTGCVRYAMAEYSYDNSSWNTINDNRASLTEIAIDTTIPASGSFIYLRFTSGNAANSAYIGTTTNPFIITGVIDTSSLSTLRNYPTNKDIIKQYSTTLGSATTSATYRATKWGFPAIEYSATEYQFLDVDTTATGSTVAFSETGASYTTVADGASLTITSTSTPNIFVKTNITANRLYLSSNDYVASSNKDGSLKQSVVYQVIQ